MRRIAYECLTLMPLAWLLLGGAVAGDDGDDEIAAAFRKVKTSLQQKLHDRNRESRLAAVEHIASFHTPEAAKVLLHSGLGSGDAATRYAAANGLVKFGDDEEVCKLLKNQAADRWLKGTPTAETFGCLTVLLASPQADVQQAAAKEIERAAWDSGRGRLLLIQFADFLGLCGGEASVPILARLTDLPLYEQDFAFRRAVVQALTHIQRPEAVSALIKRLDAAQGEVQSDILHYLARISGDFLSDDAKVWQVWWDEHVADFRFPPADVDKPTGHSEKRLAAQANTPSYYGLRINAQRLIFVIDCSESMRGPKLEAAKLELLTAIAALPANADFNVIVFNRTVASWQPTLVPAQPVAKQEAAQFVTTRTWAGGTASYDALEQALTFNAEAIYFVTDGMPIGGKVTVPSDIVRLITNLNQSRRMTINCVGISVRGKSFQTFLADLAQQNFGVYRSVGH